MPIRKSIAQDFIICLEDGKKLKMLKRHLASRYSLTPDDYRRRWGLPASYPMVAPAYAARRSALAKQIGLGRKRRRRHLNRCLRPKRPDAGRPNARRLGRKGRRREGRHSGARSAV